jgi:phage terminase large subunit GpA-like protein
MFSASCQSLPCSEPQEPIPPEAWTMQAGWFKTLKRQPRLTISEWADKERRLSPEASAEPGRWSTNRAEYQRGIMDAISDPSVHTVVIMSSAQVGKSEIWLNAVGYYIDQDPSPILVVLPTLEMAEAFSKDRVAPMLRDTPALQGKVNDPKTRDSGNTLRHKSFPGGHLTLSGANSPASLASRPIRVVVCDEVDRYDDSAGSEGDPVSLATKRSNNFWNRKLVIVSTPTLKSISRIEKAYAASDRRKCYTAHYACSACGPLWDDLARWGALRKCAWSASVPFNGVAGFHLSELYSPWRTLEQIVTDFLQKRHDPSQLQTFINTSLGETWEEKGETVSGHALVERIEAYDDRSIPRQVSVLTAA